MQKSKRIKIIKKFINEHKDVQISDINKIIDVSESTIRRDIKELAEEGFLKELYGSVILLEQNEADILYDERIDKNIKVKNMIAKKAVRYIKDHSFIYIDAGSTTIQMVKFIENKNITVVTNGVDTAFELAKRGITTQLIGGELKAVTMAMVGEVAIENLNSYHFDMCFMGANGINDLFYSTPDIKEGMIKKKVIKQSRKAFVLADQSKMFKITSYMFAERDECILITE